MGQPTSLCCGAVWWRGVWEGTMLLVLLLASFQSLPPLPTSKLGPSGADSQVGGFVYILGPCETLLWGWEFLLLPRSPQVFTARGFEALVSHAGTLGCTMCLAPQLFLLVYPHMNVGVLSPPAAALPTQSTNLPLILSAPAVRLCPSYQSGWVSLTSWLSDFHTVRFSGISVVFLFSNLLSFFGCTRKQDISTYASNLAGSLLINFYWDIIDISHWVNLRCTTCWYGTLTYCNMIPTVAWANTSITPHNYHFFFVVGTVKM